MPIRQQVEEIPQINLTAMIDVLFLLIIFFVVGTEFIRAERQIELQLPKVGKNEALSAAPEKKVINVYRDGQITYEKQEVSLEELHTRLAAARKKYAGLGVLVRGDASVHFERVASVLSTCKQAGIQDLAISVELAQTASHAVR